MKSRKRLMMHPLQETRGYQPVAKKELELDVDSAKDRTNILAEEESVAFANVHSRRLGILQKVDHNLPPPPPSLKRRLSSVVLSDQPTTSEVEAYLRDEIQDFNLTAICEDDDDDEEEESHHSDTTLEQSNLASNKKINQSCQSASTVTNSSISNAHKSRPTSSNQPMEQGYINDLMRNILDVAISKAQLAHDKTEIELVLERNNDTEVAHDEVNFIQKALSNFSCTKQDPVPKPSVLAKITVHVVPIGGAENLPQQAHQWQRIESMVSQKSVGTSVTSGLTRPIRKSNELLAPHNDSNTGVRHPLKPRNTNSMLVTEAAPAAAADDPRNVTKPDIHVIPPPPKPQVARSSMSGSGGKP